MLKSAWTCRICCCAVQVLHHGAPIGNALWEYDGWGPGYAHGGIYHEHAPDTEWVRSSSQRRSAWGRLPVQRRSPWTPVTRNLRWLTNSTAALTRCAYNPQGRAFAFWKREVVDMMRDACEMWLGPEYGADGLRFDSANDFPKETVQARLQPLPNVPNRCSTCIQIWADASLQSVCPGHDVGHPREVPGAHTDCRGVLAAPCCLTALAGRPLEQWQGSGLCVCLAHLIGWAMMVGEGVSALQVTPENPMSVHELGFDSVWVHSGYFDIIQQTRALGRGHHGGNSNPF